MASAEFTAKINRINELAHKKKQEGLNEAEKAEQKELYKWYLGNIKASLSSQLDNIEVVDDPKATNVKKEVAVDKPQA